MPQSQPNHQLINANGGELSVYQWGEAFRGEAPTLVLAHATGFHARCWDQVISHLGDRHIIALDQRGHGHSDKRSFDSWRDFGEDLQALLNHLEVTQAFGVGHSMGGHATVVAAAAQPELYQRLLLIDPVILEPAFYDMWNPNILTSEPTHPAARRRAVFKNVEAMIERYRERLPYSLFTAEAMQDYCRYGLVPTPDADVELACPPQLEARIYDTVCSNQTILDQVASIEVPVTVVRAMQPRTQEDIMDFRYSPTWPNLADHFPNGHDICLPELTHFMPMQAPELVARLISEPASGQGTTSDIV
ncbi:alpha/beta hydrolase [Pseudomaricurvus alkylphenolicus]|jgi:pimeloyl-ACP methyl ester carboxylesterase|uniref:alpha/beta fold hydrolase n=1 Tax=Pseudomaricurvus alkylphenolicus TaxID=1306991 RepID=UPI00141EE18D|nr:alpha/beta hydrolase [Pseudomaricurvus alkylphenolicus]NIB39652.1 alpha/beta hydrolase [Pseudomaricurvus alkylphenolicus]